MLNNYSEDLCIAYREKEDILDIIHSTESPEIKKKSFSEWVKRKFDIQTITYFQVFLSINLKYTKKAEAENF